MSRVAPLALLLALAACSSAPETRDRQPPPPPPPPPVAEPPPAPRPPDEEEPPSPEPVGEGAGAVVREASLLVVNGARRPIRSVYVSDCTETAWGPDLLDEGAAIAPGESLSFALQGGCWDLRAVLADGSETVRRTAQIQTSRWRWVVRRTD